MGSTVLLNSYYRMPILPASVATWNGTPAETLTPGQSGTITDIWFNAAGTNAYLCNDSSDSINQWSMSPGWDFSSLVFVSTWAMPAAVSRPFGMVITPDEDFVIIADITNHAVTSRAILTPGDITTTTDTVTTSVTTVGVTSDSDMNGLAWADEGNKLYFVNNAGAGYWPMSTPYDFSTTGTAVYVNFATVDPVIDVTGGGADIQVSEDGTRMWFMWTTNPWEVKQYDLGTQWEPSSAVLFPATGAGFVSVGAGTNTQCLFIRETEKEMWTHDISTDDFYLFTDDGIAQGADPYFDSVSLLLSMDGTDGGTTFTDLSNNAYTITPQDVTTSDEQIKFGSASAKFTGDSDNGLRTSTSATIISSSTNDFTMEAWIYILGDPYGGSSVVEGTSFHTIINEPAGGNNSDQGWYIHYTGSIGWYRGPTGHPSQESLGGGTGLVTNDGLWHHVAYSYKHDETTMRAFIDGVRVAIKTDWADGGWFSDAGEEVRVGDWLPSTQAWRRTANAHIDDLRVTDGVCRYTGDFTPPTKAHITF